MKKASLFLFIPLFVFFVLNLEAGVIDSGHNVLRQSTDDESGADEGKAGVCSYCHIPHSSTGNTMWTGSPDTVYDPAIGEVGIICGKCHDKTDTFGDTPGVAESIFTAKPISYMNHPLVDDNSDYYGVADTSAVTNIISGRNGGTRQWMSGWPATQPNRVNQKIGKVTMECTSCHNVHDVSRSGVTFNVNHVEDNVPLNGTGASGEFLRARAFDTLSELGNTGDYVEADGTNSKQIFCEYCHIGRSTSGWGPWNTTRVDGRSYSTHPVGRGDIVRGQATKTQNNMDRRVIYDNDMGWESSIVIPPELRTKHSVINVTKNPNTGGHVGGTFGRISGLGYDTSDGSDSTGIVICQTCHKPHSSDKTPIGQTHEGSIIPDDEYGKYMFGTSIPDLLVINNSSVSGYNRLCEACHSYRPFIRTAAINQTTGDTDVLDQNGKPKFKGHPLKHNKFPNGSYKFDASGDTTNVWTNSNDLCDSEPAIVIPAEWPTGDHNEPVCLSCHDVHGGRPGTKLLRYRSPEISGSGNLLICDDCHKKALYKLGLTHPLNETLTNTDGARWPDQANLTIFAPPMFEPGSTTLRLNVNERKLYDTSLVDYSSNNNYSLAKYDTSVKVGCDTCHDWANGMIHYYAGKRRDVVAEAGGSHTHSVNEDPNHNSELCVSCHTGDPYNPNTDTKNYDYGIDGDQRSLGGQYFIENSNESTNIAIAGANPSAWIREYPRVINSFETSALSRLGTHPSGLRVEYNTGASGYRNHLEYIYFKPWENGSSNCNNNKLENLNSKLVSKWGQRFDTLADKDSKESKKYAKIICQSCHTPHWANEGLVEYNTAGIGIEDPGTNEPTPHSAILYAPQTESFMCRNCHFPSGTHPVSKLDSYLSRWEKKDGVRGVNGGYQLDYYNNLYNREYNRTYYANIDLVSATNSSIQLTVDQELENLSRARPQYLLRDNSKADPWGSTWSVSISHGPMPPANYPKRGGSKKNSDIGARGLPGQAVDTSGASPYDSSALVCDSCHAPHAANTGMGTFILEANFDSAPIPGSRKANGATWNGSAEPSIREDTPTCYLCHNK